MDLQEWYNHPQRQGNRFKLIPESAAGVETYSQKPEMQMAPNDGLYRALLAYPTSCPKLLQARAWGAFPTAVYNTTIQFPLLFTLLASWSPFCSCPWFPSDWYTRTVNLLNATALVLPFKKSHLQTLSRISSLWFHPLWVYTSRLPQHSVTQFQLSLASMWVAWWSFISSGGLWHLCLYTLLSLNSIKLGWGSYQMVLRTQTFLPFSAQHLQLLSLFL